MARKKDDSNKFVVSMTMFNRTSQDPLVIAALLGALVVYGLWVHETFFSKRQAS